MKQFFLFNSHLRLMTDEDVRFPVNSKQQKRTGFASGGGIDSCCVVISNDQKQTFPLVWLNITFFNWE